MKKLILPVLILSAALAGCSTQKKPEAPQAQAAPPPPAPPPAQTMSAPKNVEVTVDGVEGFQDTPLQPDGRWHVHDPARPQPPVVTPGTFSAEATPPSDAVVLFNGSDMSQWLDRKTGGPVQWHIEDGVMVAAKGDIVCTNQFGDMQLHVEFLEPDPGNHSGQDRGNSGVFLMGHYEIQVLDCYQAKTYADGMTAAIYGQHPPLVNACKPPGEWQTYDIIFNVPHFDDSGKLITPACATVIFNGVIVQNHQAIRGDTNWKSPGQYSPTGATGPIALQFHNHPVRYRNIWVRPIEVNNEP